MEGRAHHHSVHRIVLPSGRKIEVVRFHEDLAKQACHSLHVCRQCGAPLVQPVSWSETADEHWQLELACPNCGLITSGTFTQAEVEELEDRLEEGLSEMLADLHRLAQANMADEVERFVTALDANVILPEDF